MGIRDAIGDKWAQFRAYLHSIPPHVWLGLIIGAVALILAYLAWKNRNNDLSPLSQLTPLSDTTTTTTTPATPAVTLPAVPDLGNLIYPPGSYYNYNTQQPVKQKVTAPKPSVGIPFFSQAIGGLFGDTQAEANAALNGAANARAAAASAISPTTLSSIQAAQSTAIQNFQQSEIASWTAPLVAKPQASTAIQNFQQSEIASWTAPLVAPANRQVGNDIHQQHLVQQAQAVAAANLRAARVANIAAVVPTGRRTDVNINQ